MPDSGGYYPLGDSGIVAMSAHFLHSVGNFQFYYPISKILFSGDMGVSLVGHSDESITDFNSHIRQMECFHRRYMTSKKVTRLWADAVRELDVSMMVPQHGLRLENKEVFDQFLDWISQLDCGIDLFDQQSYQFKQHMSVPTQGEAVAL